jgi:hypothetical protein
MLDEKITGYIRQHFRPVPDLPTEYMGQYGPQPNCATPWPLAWVPAAGEQIKGACTGCALRIHFAGDAGPGRTRYASRRQEGAELLDQAALCAELARPTEALRTMVPDATVLPLWRAPGGIVTPQARRMATACGLRHQGWTANGFLGDELASETHPNAALLQRNLDKIRDGEVLVMHWGVRSRREPFAGIFDALIGGLQARGFCFRPLPPHGV